MAYTPNNNPYIAGDPYSYDLKWIISELKHAIELYTPLSDEFTNLYNYVHDYFDNLDISEEVREQVISVIDDLEAQGFFNTLVGDIVTDSGTIEATVTQWLIDNVNPVGSAVVVDNTLSITGAAADARVTGNNDIIINSIIDYNDVADTYDMHSKKITAPIFQDVYWQYGSHTMFNQRRLATMYAYHIHKGDAIKIIVGNNNRVTMGLLDNMASLAWTSENYLANTTTIYYATADKYAVFNISNKV